MTYQNLLTERIEKVALITLNRPEKLNALSYELACELDEELTKIEKDDDVSVVILTGAGPRAFSAGGDIHQMVKSTPEELAARSEIRSRATWHLASFSKPIIGAINGLAYGAGAQLTSMLDIRIGCEHAEFQFLAAKYGRENSHGVAAGGRPAQSESCSIPTGIKADEAGKSVCSAARTLRSTSRSALEMAQQISANDARMFLKGSSDWCMKHW
jgi:hypothetical protein